MYDIRRLRMLLEIKERGSLAAAARTLHLTPSAISQQMVALEKEVGVALIRRVGRSVQLTEAGLIVVDSAKSILREMDAASTRLANLSGEPSGTLRIAIFQSAAIALLADTLLRLQETAPKVYLKVDQIDPESGLELTRSRQFDMVIAEIYPGFFAPQFDDLHLLPLIRDPLHLVVAQASPIESLEDAAQAAWVFEGSHNTSRTWAVNQCRAAGFEPEVHFDIEDLLTHCNLVRGGFAAALLPSFMTGSLPQDFGLKLIDLPGRPQREIYTAVRADKASDPAILALRQALSHAAQKLPYTQSIRQ
ncbi:MAG: LysR family transcriptional regulator [Rothia sp. (in: high G+C Gram-positive bacteria)]|nr:LysR family transcriptional regulator [Rothia sp. (in: high G+C Gram-positive bacteria)]